MTTVLHPSWTGLRPVIGMVHLAPLPGSPRFAGDRPAVREAALRDADTLARGGVHGLMVENYGDVPFHPRRVPASTVAEMTAVAAEVRRRVDLPLGINVLRNDGVSALAVAHAVGADFIRVNVLCGAQLTDQGILEGIAHELLRERRAVGAEAVRILADVMVKHSAPLADYGLEAEIADALERGGADAVIVSGVGTGKPTNPAILAQAKAAAGDAPVLVGSGVTPETVPGLGERADGFVVGTSLKMGGDVTAPVDLARVQALMAALA